LIYDAWVNFNETMNIPIPYTTLVGFIKEQDVWVRTMVKTNPNDEYWAQVGLTLAQFDGLVAGYMKYAPVEQPIGYIDFF